MSVPMQGNREDEWLVDGSSNEVSAIYNNIEDKMRSSYATAGDPRNP